MFVWGVLFAFGVGLSVILYLIVLSWFVSDWLNLSVFLSEWAFEEMACAQGSGQEPINKGHDCNSSHHHASVVKDLLILLTVLVERSGHQEEDGSHHQPQHSYPTAYLRKWTQVEACSLKSSSWTCQSQENGDGIGDLVTDASQRGNCCKG